MENKAIVAMHAWNYMLELFDDSTEESSDDEYIYNMVIRNRPAKRTDFVNLVRNELNGQDFKSHLRMSKEAFENIINILGPHLQNNNLEGRPTVNIITQFLSVLWLLATPDSYRSVSERFGLSKSSLFECFKRMIAALNLMATYKIKWPRNEESHAIKTRFPDCIGVVDGSYIQIKAPKTNGEVYICRKRFYAVNLQAVCDHKLRFTDCFVGYPGSVNDRRIFRKSYIVRNILEDVAQYFPNSEYILGDKAYPLKSWCLRPYINRGNLTHMQTNFNTQLSRVRSMIERAFSLLKGRFRRLKYLDMTRINLVPQTILACCVLHNLCLDNGDMDEQYILDGREVGGEIENPIHFQEVVGIDDDEAGHLKRDVLARNMLHI